MGNFDVEKTIVVPDSGGTGNNFLAGMLASACQSKGLDANAVMALCGNRNGSFGNGWDGIIALIVIAAIFGGNGNGLFGGNNNNSTERQMLMDAIQRNGVDVSQLASTLNCSVGQVQAVIINNAQQSAAFAQMIGQAVAPLNAGINSLNTEIAGIKCHLPETKVIPCGDNYVKVNTGFNIPLQVSPAAYGACGAFGGYGAYGYPYGVCGNNGGWG